MKIFWFLICQNFHILKLIFQNNVSLGIVRSLPLGPRGLAVRRLPRTQEVVFSNHSEDKICFSQFTPFYEVDCENLFYKINFKI